MPIFKDVHIRSMKKFREYVDKEVTPFAKDFDIYQAIPRDYFYKLGKDGFLGVAVPVEYGGQGLDYVTLGLLHEEFGRGYCSIENVLTVYGMVCKSLCKFGTSEQKIKLLPKIMSGELVVAIAITEPMIGSDIKSIKTEVKEDGDSYILNGEKKYITLGQIADLFLVIAKCNGRGTAFFIEKNTSGLTIKPINNILGLRGNMLAELQFHNCIIPQDNFLGKIGQGLTHIASCALDEGRYTTACGCLGLGQICLEKILEYTHVRQQSNVLLSEHQLVQKMMTEVIVSVKAAREVCFNAGYLRDCNDIDYIYETLVAKYITSKMAVLASNHAVQIYGALGCIGGEQGVERFYRDAKIMEIIEGTSQIYEILLSKNYPES